MKERNKKRKTDKSDSRSHTTDSSISTVGIRNIIEILKDQKHRDTTKKNYYAIWKVFNNFFIKLDCKPRSWEDRLTLFVGYLVQINKKSTTVKCYISAIKAVLEQLNIRIQEDRCLFTSLTRACRLRNDKVTIRLPIQKGVLAMTLAKIPIIYSNQPYLADLYSALLGTAYFGLFRVGELTTGDHPVLVRDFHIGLNKRKMLFVLRSSKTHGLDTKPQLIKIAASSQRKYHLSMNQQSGSSSQTNDRGLELPCPFMLLWRYLARRTPYKSHTEPFFIFMDGSPVHPLHFRTCLKHSLNLAGFNERNYNTHSLWLGRSCDLYKLGLSVETIKKLGRWKSNIVFKYLHEC